MVKLLQVVMYVFGVMLSQVAFAEVGAAQKSVVPLTVSEAEAVRQEFFICWTPPRNKCAILEGLSATVTIQLEKTGHVISAKLHDNLHYQNSSCYKAFADSVLRVFKICSPLKRRPPVEKYSSWQEMEITFMVKELN